MSIQETKVMVVWTTESNSTRQMAEAIINGVESVDSVTCQEVVLVKGNEVEPEEIIQYDGLIVGTPVRHRNMHHLVKVFIEHTLETSWLTDDMVGMVGGSFSVGGGHGDAGAGAEMCQLSILASMAASGLIIVPLPKCTPGFDHAGLHWGAVGRSGGPKMEPYWLTEAMTQTGYHHGANIARVTQAIAATRQQLFAKGNVSPPEKLTQAMLNAPTSSGVPAAGANPFNRQDPPAGFVSGQS